MIEYLIALLIAKYRDGFYEPLPAVSDEIPEYGGLDYTIEEEPDNVIPLRRDKWQP